MLTSINTVAITFSSPVNPSTIQLYSGTSNTFVANITLTAGSTSIKGSAVVDPSNPNLVTFVALQPLTPGTTYTVTVGSSVLSTTGSSLAFTGSVIVPAAAPVVAAPNVARGPGQTVNLPATSSNGIPLTISSGTTGSITVTSVSFRLTYDPTLLTIAPTLALSGVGGLNTTVSYTIVGVDAP